MTKLQHIFFACALALSMVPLSSAPAIADEGASSSNSSSSGAGGNAAGAAVLTIGEDEGAPSEVGQDDAKADQSAAQIDQASGANATQTSSTETIQTGDAVGGKVRSASVPVLRGTRSATTATLKPGGVQTVNDPSLYLRDAMESLAGNRTNVTAFKQAGAAEWAAAGSPTSTNVAESGEPVYMWYDNGTIYWYSEADTVYLNTNACWMFQGFTNLTDISGLTNLDASLASDVDRMFINCVSLTDISPIADWDTHNFTNMRFMFGASAASSPMALSDLSPLSNWDVSNVTDMNSVFKFAPSISDVSPLANWDVRNVTTFEQMFNMNGTTSKLSDVSALAGWKPLSGGNFNKMFQKTPMTKSYLESTLFTAMRGTWTDPSTTSGTAGGGKFTPYMKKTIVVTKTWDDVNNDYDTRPADGDALNLRLSFDGSGLAPTYDDPTNVPVANTEWTYSGNTWTAKLTVYTTNLITSFKVTEDAVPAGYVDPGTVDVDVTGIGDGEAKMTNTLKTHSITVRKSVTGDASDTSKFFDFTFTSKKADGTTARTDTFNIADSAYYTITSIPYGATYSVVEDDYSTSQYSTSVSPSGDPATGTVDADKDITFVNDRSKRTITITKTWDDNNNEMGQRPTTGFNDVVLTTTTAGGATATYTTTAAGWTGPGTSANTWTYTFAIDPAETVTGITESTVPAGYTCTTSTVSDSGYPAESGSASLTNAINRYALTVDKQVTGNMGDKTRAFNFTFTTNASGSFDAVKTDSSGSQTTSTIVAGDGFTLKDGENLEIQGIPHGANYSVTEDDANANGYTTTTTGAPSGTMNADKAATFINNRQAVIPTGVAATSLSTPWRTGMLVCALATGAGLFMLAWRMHRQRTKVLTSE